MSTEETRGEAAGTSQMSAAARQRVLADLGDGRDITNPAYLFQQTATALLLAIAASLIDPVALARRELAGRGLDADGAVVRLRRGPPDPRGDQMSGYEQLIRETLAKIGRIGALTRDGSRHG